MARKKKPAADAPRVHHPRSCQCKATGLIEAPAVEVKGHLYPKVSVRCPGTPLQTAAPAPAAAAHDGQQLAAGEGRS